MGWHMGVDIGSWSCKGVLLGDNGQEHFAVTTSGADYAQAGKQVLETLLRDADIDASQLNGIVATGVGARQFGAANSTVGDVIAAARGIAALYPDVQTYIDVGSQSSRVIWLDESGRVSDFSANDKCATGSGRFLQVIANVLRIELEEIGPLSLRSENPIQFTTGCAVFGESEAITRVSEGIAPRDIIAGVHRSLAEKIGSLMRVRGIRGRCAVGGGGALDVALVHHLEQRLETQLVVPPSPRIIGAYGAAMQSRRNLIQPEKVVETAIGKPKDRRRFAEMP